MKFRETKIGFIGRLDQGCTLFDGQTVKTRMMFRLLCEEYGEENIVVVDTLDYRHNALRVTTKTIRCLFLCKHVFVLLSRNGRKVLFPLLAFAARHIGTNVYHNLIGGRLAKAVQENPGQVRQLNNFKVNWVESALLEKQLCDAGVKNAEFLPNFKYLENAEVQKTKTFGPSYRFCTFSRVHALKGVGDAMATVEQLCAEGYDCKLDIYGPIDASFEEGFKQKLASCPHCEYVGCVAPEKSAQAISTYDALLFPTEWKAEGMPGTIIDALSAGVPVIGAKWEFYDEMLEDGVTGFGYEFEHNEQLEGCIEEFMALGNDANRLREGCLARAKLYTPEVALNIVKQAFR